MVDDAALALGDPLPSRMALSVDAAATRRALLLSASLFGIFLLVCMSLRRARHARWLLWVLVFGGLGQALYGSVMTLSGLEFGAWGAKDAYRGYATGTFVNRNHFAGYLELCLAATFGLIVALPMPRSERRGWRQAWSDGRSAFCARGFRAGMQFARSDFEPPVSFGFDWPVRRAPFSRICRYRFGHICCLRMR